MTVTQTQKGKQSEYTSVFIFQMVYIHTHVTDEDPQS